jgi:hypothetical protein
MLFRAAGLPMVENCMAGYNSCVFAYGQVLFNLISHLLFPDLFMFSCPRKFHLFTDWKWENLHHAW